MPAEPTLPAGLRIGGDFEIQHLLGGGGMGEVYVARQLSTSRERALKVMHANFQRDPNLRRRFVQEAQVGARIQSSHVIEVIAAGVDDALGLPWLAMEYLHGSTLEAMMKTRGVPPEEHARALLAQLFHAVGAAHDAGVVHRDLKPENVFLALATSPGQPFNLKVLDFGIAKLLAEDAGRVTDGLWTLLWGAPEQTGPSRDISARADVWALGLLVFWLLTGETYWHSERPAQMIIKEIMADPLTPASRRASELGCAAALSKGFDDWFLRCVSRAPSERFANARDAEASLRSVELPFPQRARGWSVAGEAIAEGALEFGSATTNLAVPGAAATRPADGTVNLSPTTTNKANVALTSPPLSRRVGLRWPFAALALAFAGLAAYRWSPGRTARNSPAAPTHAQAALAAAPSTPTASSVALIATPANMRLVSAATSSAGPFRTEYAEGEHTTATTPAIVTKTAAFFIDANEVDADSYAECVARGACSDAVLPSSSPFATLCNARQPGRGQHPINCVNLEQARSYCKFRGKRLPRESEWERAARGDDGRQYPWGNQPPASCDVAVVSTLCDRAPAPTRPVGSRSAAALSPFGVADLAGNVWEWVEDDFTAPAADRERFGTLRGGGWDYKPAQATTTVRLRAASEHADVNRGLRCALSP